MVKFIILIMSQCLFAAENQEVLNKKCESNKNPKACESLYKQLKDSEPSLAFYFAEKACNGGIKKLCNTDKEADENTSESKIEKSKNDTKNSSTDSHDEKLNKMCESGKVNACEKLYLKLRKSDESLANYFATRACELGKKKYCDAEDLNRIEQEKIDAVINKVKNKCESGDANTCWSLYTKNLSKDRELALNYLEKACMMGHQKSCSIKMVIDNQNAQNKLLQLQEQKINNDLAIKQAELEQKQEAERQRIRESIWKPSQNNNTYPQKTKKVCKTRYDGIGNLVTECEDSF